MMDLRLRHSSSLLYWYAEREYLTGLVDVLASLASAKVVVISVTW